MPRKFTIWLQRVDRWLAGEEVILPGTLAGNAAEAFLDQLLQAPARAVAGQHAQVMDMDRGAAVGVGDLVVIDLAEPVVRRDGAGVGQDQSAHGIGHGGVFLHPPVVDAQIVVHQVFIVQERGIDVADFLPLFAVKDISLGDIGITGFGQHFFDAVLDRFHRDLVVADQRLVFSRNPKGKHIDNAGMILLLQRLKGLGDGF